MENSSKKAPLYCFGCDMGGWHNTSKTKGDALAVCKWDGSQLQHIEATADVTFYPINADSIVQQLLDQAISESAKIVVGIDAALAWPKRFRDMVNEVPSGEHDFQFELNGAIANPYLYRETERFIKAHVQTGATESPLTAVGDKFGNNSSKAQALAKWFQDHMVNPYRPPFDPWELRLAATKDHTIIEVYPAASMKSKAFKSLSWPTATQSMESVGNTDIADAKRCAMTAFCYAIEIGMIEATFAVPGVWTPDDASDDIDMDAVQLEGWIYAPMNKPKPAAKK